jgi:hypothetical protein
MELGKKKIGQEKEGLYLSGLKHYGSKISPRDFEKKSGLEQGEIIYKLFKKGDLASLSSLFYSKSEEEKVVLLENVLKYIPDLLKKCDFPTEVAVLAGHFYMRGVGCTKDVNRAVLLYNLAVRGSVETKIDALYNLGFCHENGVGVEANAATAAERYKNASEMLSSYSQARHLSISCTKIDNVYRNQNNLRDKKSKASATTPKPKLFANFWSNGKKQERNPQPITEETPLLIQ